MSKMATTTAQTSKLSSTSDNDNGQALVPVRHRTRRPRPTFVAEEQDRAQVPAGADERPGGQSGEYEVGYGRPPKRSQFKKGQSGNRKGRPKGAKSASAIVKEVLTTRMTVKIDGVTKSLTALEIAFNQQVKKAIAGDQKALTMLLSHLPPNEAGNAQLGMQNNATAGELDASERAMLAHHHRAMFEAEGLDEQRIVSVLAQLGLGDNGLEGS